MIADITDTCTINSKYSRYLVSINRRVQKGIVKIYAAEVEISWWNPGSYFSHNAAQQHILPGKSLHLPRPQFVTQDFRLNISPKGFPKFDKAPPEDIILDVWYSPWLVNWLWHIQSAECTFKLKQASHSQKQLKVDWLSRNIIMIYYVLGKDPSLW